MRAEQVRPGPPGETVRLSKHHGLGNDFLVLVDARGREVLDAASARALCDRRRGLGADGVVRAQVLGGGAAGAVVRMELRNADGSEAEISGNGLRCLVQAVRAAGLVRERQLVVDTAAGPREVVVEAEHGAVSWIRTAMGRVRLGPAQPAGAGCSPSIPWCARHADVGNPHLVLWEPDAARLESLDLERLGPPLERAVPGGQNVEWVSVVAGGLALRVWERGVGETDACGSGSVAAAAAAAAWGLVPGRVSVRNPGGTLEVALDPAGAWLTGPSVMVATIEVARSWLEEAAARPAGAAAAGVPLAVAEVSVAEVAVAEVAVADVAVAEVEAVPGAPTEEHTAETVGSASLPEGVVGR